MQYEEEYVREFACDPELLFHKAPHNENDEELSYKKRKKNRKRVLNDEIEAEIEGFYYVSSIIFFKKKRKVKCNLKNLNT